MRKKIFKSVSYLVETEVVILAGGQARRMNGINKLLQNLMMMKFLSKFISS